LDGIPFRVLQSSEASIRVFLWIDFHRDARTLQLRDHRIKGAHASLRRPRSLPRSDVATRGALGLPLRIRESAQVLAKQARGVHQGSERREIAGASVRAEEVETDGLERGDALGEMRRRHATLRHRVERRCADSK
jgi:hypothetical protein